MIGVFVTGTDTDCGKTAVACALARAGRGSGARVRVVKPAETGCEERDGRRLPADALALANAAGDSRPIERICPYRLGLPVAPALAAREERTRIEQSTLEAAVNDAATDADLVIVEGAGGLLVPLNETANMADLASHLDLPLLVVARARLGTLNHTLLTLEAARARGLNVLGVAISHVDPDLTPADRKNLDLLLEMLPVPLVGELPHGASELNSFDFGAFCRAVAGP